MAPKAVASKAPAKKVAKPAADGKKKKAKKSKTESYKVRAFCIHLSSHTHH